MLYTSLSTRKKERRKEIFYSIIFDNFKYQGKFVVVLIEQKARYHHFLKCFVV